MKDHFAKRVDNEQSLRVVRNTVCLGGQDEALFNVILKRSEREGSSAIGFRHEPVPFSLATKRRCLMETPLSWNAFVTTVFPTQWRLFYLLMVAMSAMLAYVYKSRKKPDTYVFVTARDDFSRLPDDLRVQLEPLEFVLDVRLTPERKLAHVDAVKVRDSLHARGFFIQFPPVREALEHCNA